MHIWLENEQKVFIQSFIADKFTIGKIFKTNILICMYEWGH